MALSLLSWFLKAKLKCLRVGLRRHGRRREYLYDLQLTLCEIVASHKATLKQVMLCKTWQNFPKSFQPLVDQWDSQFALTDMALASRKVFVRRNPSSLKKAVEDKLFGRIGHKPYDNPRARMLQRLRLEAPQLEDIQPCWPPNGVLNNLRILIVCPAQAWEEDKSLGSISQSAGGRLAHALATLDPQSPQETHFPLEPSEFAEGRLAHALAVLGPPSLRYIMIGVDRFWVDYIDDGQALRVLHFRHAWGGSGGGLNEIRGLAIRKEIQEWMSEEDWRFVDGEPWLRPRSGLTPERNPFAVGLAWNVAIARPVG